MKINMHCYVRGLVQGVYYRQTTKEKAQILGLTGWVRNLNDGRVEVMVSGEQSQVERLVEWLWEGPEAAKVVDVWAEDMIYQEFLAFTIEK